MPIAGLDLSMIEISHSVFKTASKSSQLRGAQFDPRGKKRHPASVSFGASRK